jgi:dTDP-glucose 4,6-dehydratase
MDTKKPRKDGKSYSDLISFVEDRAGHDWRYA